MQNNDASLLSALRAAYPHLQGRADDYVLGFAAALIEGPLPVTSATPAAPDAVQWISPHLWDRSSWERDYSAAVQTGRNLAGRCPSRPARGAA